MDSHQNSIGDLHSLVESVVPALDISGTPAGGRSQAKPASLTRILHWYYSNFICGFCFYLPLPLLLLATLGLMWGIVASDYGPAYLFFHDDLAKELVVGLSLGFLWAELLFVGYLFWLRDARINSPPGSREYPTAKGSSPISFAAFARRTFLCFVATLLSFKLIVVVGERLFRVLGKSEWSQLPSTHIWSPRDAILFLGIGIAWIMLWCFGRIAYHWSARHAVGWLAGRFATKPKTTKRVTVWRRTIRMAIAALVPLAWIGVIFALCVELKNDLPHYAVLALVAFGLMVTVSSSLPSLRKSAGLFWTAVAANIILAYTGVSWCVSNGNFLAGLGAAAVIAGVGAIYVRMQSPDRWEKVYDLVVSILKPMGTTEQAYLLTGIMLFSAGLIILMLLSFCPYLASPVPIVIILLASSAGIYGLLTCLLPRSFLLVVGIVALFALIGSIQPYRIRFNEAIPYYDDKHLLELVTQLEGKPGQERDSDLGRQAEFDQFLDTYKDNDSEYQALQETIKNIKDELRFGKANQTDLAALQSQLSSASAQEKANRAAHDKLMEDLAKTWQEMEKRNRVRAGRLLASLKIEYPELAGLTRVRPNGAPGLLRIDELQVRPRIGGEAKGPLVVIVVSGGGIRAAVWTFQVLKELELFFSDPDNGSGRQLDFPSHVRLISGASGGMVGAAYYVATLPPPENRPPQLAGTEAWQHRKLVLEEQQNRLSEDFLTPIVQRLVLNDIPSMLSPWPSRHDRGQALEKAWSRFLKNPATDQNRLEEIAGPGTGALDVTFATLREGERMGWRPSLVFTPMMIEDGRRLIISNLDLRSTICNDGWVLTQESAGELSPVQPRDNHSVEAVELFRMFNGDENKFTLANAARMSASFPYLSPAAPLPTVPRRRIVDAGYYDNYGVSLAASWLFSKDNRDWREKNFSRTLVIQIRDGLTERERQLRSISKERSGLLSRTFEELLSPVEGLLNARVASCSFRNDNQLELLNSFDELERKSKAAGNWRGAQFLVANFELGNPPSLSWYLSESERARISGEVKTVDNSVRNIFDWFGGSPER